MEYQSHYYEDDFDLTNENSDFNEDLDWIREIFNLQ